MTKKFLNIFLQLFFPTLIFLTVLGLAWKNYVPGTILSGWDSLHPEFNFSMAVKRAIFGAWRAEQGIGVIAAHAHMADLPRILFLWASSFFVQTNFLRYFYIFLCLLIGPLGAYFFLKHVFSQKHKGFFVNAAAGLGAFYYLMNLGTLQHFYLPFEMFNTQFAFLPWLFLFSLKILDSGGKKNYLTFLIFSILSSPMAYAPTLFYAYLGALAIFVIVFILLTHKKNVFGRGVLIGLLVLATNAFWILPNLYSVKNQSETISNSKINMLFSPEAFLRNKDYGTVSNVLIHKGFLFSWRAFDFEENTYKDLFENWNNHLANPTIMNLAWVFVGVSVLGAVLCLSRKSKVGFALIFVSLFALFFLVNENHLTANLYKYLYDNFGIFREGYRMPFTKFSILLMFGMSFTFGFFFLTLFSALSKKKILRPILLGVTGLSLFGLVLFFMPGFRGDLISRVVKNNIPKEYFEVYDFLNTKEGRIAKLPVQTLYNWEYHNWVFEGTGWFSWFLSKNPLLDRDFDRWSAGNEDFYNEFSYAIYSKNEEAIKNVLKKYRVSYLLLDESIINAGGTPETLYIPETKEILAKAGINKIKQDGFLSVYETRIIGQEVSAPSSYTEVGSVTNYGQIDPLYINFGDYSLKNGATKYPFLDFDKRGETRISEKDGKLVFENREENVTLSFPADTKISEDFSLKRGHALGFNCDLLKEGRVDKEWKEDSVRYFAENGGVSCDFFDYSNLDYGTAYVLRVKGENKAGRGLKIYLYNFAEKRMNLEELLPIGNFDEYFVIYPKQIEEKGGYSLNIETRSFGSIPSENVLREISFYPFDLQTVTSVYQGNEIPLKTLNNLQVKNVKDLGNKYLVETSGSGLLTLNQGYDEGWKAFAIQNSKLKSQNYSSKLKSFFTSTFPWWFGEELTHVKVNSWGNGWRLDNSQCSIINSQKEVVGLSRNENCEFVIIYWPQYLQWGGMALIPVTLGVILLWSRKKKSLSF